MVSTSNPEQSDITITVYVRPLGACDVYQMAQMSIFSPPTEREAPGGTH